MKKLTAEWVRKAEADYQLAAKLSRGSEPFHDQLCFHCQQSAEKYLKALMEELGLRVPRTHVLERLAVLLLPYHGSVRRLQRGLRFLTRFAVETRYPGGCASKRQAQSAFRWAARVRLLTRDILGIPARQPRRKKPGPGPP